MLIGRYTNNRLEDAANRTELERLSRRLVDVRVEAAEESDDDAKLMIRGTAGLYNRGALLGSGLGLSFLLKARREGEDGLCSNFTA